MYQWLNNVYEARVWSYGLRTMLDFMLPEPGAFLLDRATDPALEKSDDIKVIPVFTAKPKDIKPEDYMKYAADYGITDLETPPKAIENIAGAFASGPGAAHVHSEKLEIPPGYVVTGIYASAAGVGNKDWIPYCYVDVHVVSSPSPCPVRPMTQWLPLSHVPCALRTRR